MVGSVLTLALHLFLGKTFYGRAIRGVSQDALALRLMGADPIGIKTIAFGLGVATASLAGALLIIIAPVEPSMGREYIGRTFAIMVLGGMGSIGGTFCQAPLLVSIPAGGLISGLLAIPLRRHARPGGGFPGHYPLD